jgi:hypothetical protein
MRFHHSACQAARAARGAVFCLATLVLLPGCGGGSGNTGVSPAPGTPLLSHLRTAPEQVTLRNGQSLRLTAFLWRDFQPISPPDGKPLIAVFRVGTTDQTPLTGGTRVDGAWVVLGDEVWDARPAEEHPRDPGSHTLEVVGRNGPKWGPGVSVDVIVQVRDQQNATYRLQVRQQPIHRTD